MSFAGEVTSREAYARLGSETSAVLIDVRTAAEWTYVGTPDLDSIGKRLHTITWPGGTGVRHTETFVAHLASAGLARDDVLFFLCRSGTRSRAAAATATAAGFTAFNVSDGFEGPLDPDGHRNTVGGWRAAGLPWRQT